MDIRASMKEIIKRYGHEIIYIRRDLRFRCECYSNREGQSNAKCKKCLGTGYSIAYERIRVRSQAVGASGLLSRSGQNIAAAGVKHTSGATYYFEHEHEPKNGDLILEVTWMEDGKVKQVLNKHFISTSDRKLGANGRIEFYQVHCMFEESREADDKTIASSSIQPARTEL